MSEPRARWVVVACPPGEELARGSRGACVFVKAFMEQEAPGREYVLIRVQQWDEEDDEATPGGDPDRI